MVGNLCALPEGGVDHALLVALKTSYDLDDLFDIIEISEVAASWRDAKQANLDIRAAERRAQ